MKKIFSYFLVFICIALIGCEREATEETSTTDTNPDLPINQNAENGALPGKFTINDNGDKIQFSQGNLQYHCTNHEWQFAAHQYDTLGTVNLNVSSSYNGWIDLFGWGTGNNPTNTSANFNDYSTFTDWGINAISNGGNKANQWRTLTKDELVYLFCTRTNASTLFAPGCVVGREGMILLPDNWVTPSEVFFTAIAKDWHFVYNDRYAGSYGDYYTNCYTTREWSLMESAGAIFLPAAGWRDDSDPGHIELSCRRREGGYTDGFYWSSTPSDHNVNTDWFAYLLNFNDCYLFSATNTYVGGPLRRDGVSVRLVRDVE